MLEYETCLSDTFVTIKNGDYQRLIWCDPQELRDRELDNEEKFHEYIKTNELAPLPDFYLDHEKYAMRFLQGCGWD